MDDSKLEELLNKGNVGSTVRVSAWDFGGQEVFASLHHLYLTPHGVYLVVFNMQSFASGDAERERKGLRELLFWLNSIFVHTGLSQQPPAVFLVGTHKDTLPDPPPCKEIHGVLAERLGYNPAWGQVVENGDLCFFPVSNKLAHKDPVLTDLMRRVREQVTAHKYERLPFPWLRVIDRVHDAKSEHVSFAEVKGMAAEAGLPVVARSTLHDEATELLALMHNYLFVMWYPEPSLMDLVIRSPTFLITAAARVIQQFDLHESDEHRAARKHKRLLWDQLVNDALLHADLLPFLWPEHDEATRTRLTFLLVKFTLAVKLGREVYLVPSLLPERDVPEELHKHVCYFVFSASGGLAERAVCDAEQLEKEGFLPFGLFSRLVGKCIEIANCSKRRSPTPVLSKRKARLSFGRFSFIIEELLHLNSVRVCLMQDSPQPITERLHRILAGVVADCFDVLRFHVVVPFEDQGGGAPTRFCTLKAIQQGEALAGIDDAAAKSAFAAWYRHDGLRESYHVMISYRWSPFNSAFVLKMFDCFAVCLAEEQGSQVEVFLDTKRLQTGKRYDLDFMDAVVRSKSVVALVSLDAVRPMAALDENSKVDNVLLEWTLALELLHAHQLRALVPLLMGAVDEGVGSESPTITDLFQELKAVQLPSVVVKSVVWKAVDFLKSVGIEPSPALHSRTVKQVFDEVVAFQGVLLWNKPNDLELVSHTGQAGLHEYCVDQAMKVLERVMEFAPGPAKPPPLALAPAAPNPGAGPQASEGAQLAVLTNLLTALSQRVDGLERKLDSSIADLRKDIAAVERKAGEHQAGLGDEVSELRGKVEAGHVALQAEIAKVVDVLRKPQEQ